MLPKRFWDKVDKSGDCWLWTAGIGKKGYADFWLDGKTRKAHHLTFTETVPQGMRLDHKCHVRHCVRPSHLRIVTNKQNGENRKGVPSSNKSGYRGVHWDAANKKWLAKVKHFGKSYFAGRFDDVEAAHKAAKAKRLELFTHNDTDRQHVVEF